MRCFAYSLHSFYQKAKLLAAMSLYSMQARGPASEKLAEVLAAECLAYWQVCFLLWL